MTTTIDDLKANFDDWVKEMNSKVCDLVELPDAMVENTGNIQHNYELATELKEEIQELKEEIKLLKLMNIVALKEKGLKH
jgi:hypothetical protein